MKILILLLFSYSLAACTTTPTQQRLTKGEKISFQRSKGNCLACHIIEEGEDPGNIGPVLVNMRQKYPDKEQLRAIIWDASAFNAQSSMPPFGRNKILSPEDLDLVVDYIWSIHAPN
ncbi:MAG: sulfur oxidation c-type cytochrome SoxX [Gammaproteobacteria bacterium]|nr:sulfur oxidation c-type cytochrome SoxX [Gammaproteobacteria bacterium]